MTKIAIEHDRQLDAIVLGRAGVDLYARELNTDIQDISGFNKFVGGSAANIAVAVNKLGGKVGFIGCVAKDSFGDYVKHYMSGLGINLNGMMTDDSGSRTSVAFTEMKPSDCDVLIYRNNASDLTLKPEQIDADYIASSKVLIVTGTALAQSPSREATLLAMQYARSSGTLVILDVDYRPYSWRTDVDASIYFGIASQLSDIVIGNREEFDMMETVVAPGNKDDDATAQRFLTGSTQVVIIKAGELGSKVYDRDGRYFEQGIFPVEVTKPFGSGDSFAGGVIWTLVNGGELEQAVKHGSAAAAINVSGTSCTEAMPTREALFNFIETREQR
ncbi:5-dehydro-2-deoxygluconokinase [Vibrio coralliilyticus]|uniref:5-dehydro-2-deoxygluconokinase n=1 Tax=Vibrio coralliilyticus TaxID=190893 RepID=UPI0006CD7782|nr:5-dehydro-2-deoxygluconokinase [Vibrio coralliilyticus]AXN30815.1 5-dehydro-2-deoxygluconokinase [Vibrio coralliilyticus]KPH27198.1 5-dehydro-2-deoxygluconokinase [Vibrio coralliilyticus]